ncbi:cholecystokinin receptor type A isoform X2 [Struthio camelus]|uniref:cholecystokinin receptor type A isoform X2 n=1 Tax=Struthio camelus TaxID=8801 RepID=UPI00360429C2
MEIVDDSLLGNATNISTFLCDIILENDTFFCVDDPPYPSKDLHQTIRILLYALIFLLSVLGNILVITVLIRNKRMRTVTNTFLLSLAVSDLMLCLFCMPFTLIPNLLKDFIFGSAVCKTATYFMGVSVSVSTFNLVAISLERYSAICKPLQSRVWQTKSHALKVIAATWCVSFTIMSPYPIYSNLVPFTKYNNSTANMCRLLWPSDVIQQSWYTFLLLILFLIPGIIMMVAYGLISLELYRGIKFDASQRKSSRVKSLEQAQRSGFPLCNGKHLRWQAAASAANPKGFDENCCTGKHRYKCSGHMQRAAFTKDTGLDTWNGVHGGNTFHRYSQLLLVWYCTHENRNS